MKFSVKSFFWTEILSQAVDQRTGEEKFNFLLGYAPENGEMNQIPEENLRKFVKFKKKSVIKVIFTHSS